MRFREEKTKKNIISVTYQYFNVVLMMPEPFALKVVALFLHALCLADTRGAGICAIRKCALYRGCALHRVRTILESYCIRCLCPAVNSPQFLSHETVRKWDETIGSPMNCSDVTIREQAKRISEEIQHFHWFVKSCLRSSM